MITRAWILGLVAAAIILPLALCLLLGVGRLLGAMGDLSGAMVLDRIALAGGLLWGLNLLLLLLAVALRLVEHE